MSSRPQVGLFGRRNAGKSSLINVLCGQEVAIVSSVPGTTTDPLRKTLEIPGIGPLVLIDTAGMDDVGLLGEKRVLKSKEVIMQINMAILIFTENFIGQYERNLIADFKQQEVPFFMVHNMSDKISLDPEVAMEIVRNYGADVIDFSCKNPENVDNLLALLEKNLGPSPFQSHPMLDGLVEAGDTVLLVCPIDTEAPEGRLILPQVQVIRELLDRKAIAVVMQPDALPAYFAAGNHPKLVITDSQLFGKVESLIPDDRLLTSFSMLLAHSKGDFNAYLEGTPAIDRLQDGDRVLLIEACSHHATCEDIGRVKVPKALKQYTGKDLHCELISAMDTPKRSLDQYALIVQCGGCMITQRQMLARSKEAQKAGVPITNFGMTLSYTQKVFLRAMQPFIVTRNNK